jgi:hypothetical protein
LWMFCFGTRTRTAPGCWGKHAVKRLVCAYDEQARVARVSAHPSTRSSQPPPAPFTTTAAQPSHPRTLPPSTQHPPPTERVAHSRCGSAPPLLTTGPPQEIYYGRRAARHTFCMGRQESAVQEGRNGKAVALGWCPRCTPRRARQARSWLSGLDVPLMMDGWCDSSSMRLVVVVAGRRAAQERATRARAGGLVGLWRRCAVVAASRFLVCRDVGVVTVFIVSLCCFMYMKVGLALRLLVVLLAAASVSYSRGLGVGSDANAVPQLGAAHAAVIAVLTRTEPPFSTSTRASSVRAARAQRDVCIQVFNGARGCPAPAVSQCETRVALVCACLRPVR